MVKADMEVYKSFEEWRQENDDGNQIIVYMCDQAQIDITGLNFCYPANIEAVRKMFIAHSIVFTESPDEFQDEIILLQKELMDDTYFMQERYQDLYVNERGKPVYNYVDRELVEKTIFENVDVILDERNLKTLLRMFKYSDLMLMYNSILFAQGKISKTEMEIYGGVTEDLIFDFTREKLVPKIKQIQ